jgi:hypothetical protein
MDTAKKLNQADITDLFIDTSLVLAFRENYTNDKDLVKYLKLRNRRNLLKIWEALETLKEVGIEVKIKNDALKG